MVHFSMTMSETLSADLAHLAIGHPDLAASLARIDGLSALLVWGDKNGLPVANIEIVVQDEYTHDAILVCKDEFLVFGLT